MRKSTRLFTSRAWLIARATPFLVHRSFTSSGGVPAAVAGSAIRRFCREAPMVMSTSSPVRARMAVGDLADPFPGDGAQSGDPGDPDPDAADRGVAVDPGEVALEQRQRLEGDEQRGRGLDVAGGGPGPTASAGSRGRRGRWGPRPRRRRAGRSPAGHLVQLREGRGSRSGS